MAGSGHGMLHLGGFGLGGGGAALCIHTYIKERQGRAGRASLSGISIHPSAFFSLILFPLLVGTHSPVLIKAFSLYLSLLVIDGTWWWWWWWWYIASFGAGRTAHRALFM
jgi:hypothetical protein